MNHSIVIICVLVALTLLVIVSVLSNKSRQRKNPRSENSFDMISDKAVKEFLSDVTSDDPATLSALNTAFDDPKVIPFDFDNESRAYAFVGHSLTVTNRMKEVDWAVGEIAIFDYFKALFEMNDIKIPEHIEYYLIAKEAEIKRGEAPELVAALLRETANKAGYEILHLNAGDDQFRFLLAPLEMAQKWNGAALGKFIKVEIPKWKAPSDIADFKVKKQRREPRSKLVRHLQKQSERAQREEDYTGIFMDKKATLIAALEESNYQEEDTREFRNAMNGHGFAIALFDITAKSLGNNYYVKDFDFKAYSLGLYYKMLAPRTSKFLDGGMSIVSVPTYVMFSLTGKLSGEKIWTHYANPYIQKLLASQKDDLQRISSQFPLMSLLIEEDNLAEKAHDLLSESYKIDTRTEPKRLYEAMIEDRIRYTRLLPDLHMSIYSSPPLSFIPLEILYVSTLIDLPLSDDLVFLRDKLINLPIETDDGIIALERYLAEAGK